MSDDIVTRLRDIASLRGNMSGSVIPVACTEAADEIERLRLACHYLAGWISHLAPDIDAKQVVQIAYDKAVRGE